LIRLLLLELPRFPFHAEVMNLVPGIKLQLALFFKEKKTSALLIPNPKESKFPLTKPFNNISLSVM